MTESKNGLSQPPAGWIRERLGEIVAIKYGKNLPTSLLTASGYPVFGANGVIGFYTQCLYEDEQVMVSCRGAYSGKINLSPPKCFVTNNSLVLEVTDSFKELRRFLFYALQAVDKSKLVTGTAQPQVTINNAEILNIPLPPLNEQRRIIAKIEELFTKLDAGVESLKAAKKQLKRYRQSVLKAAVEGELTREWREKHKDELEPASVLLERILKERRAKWEADQLAKMQAQGKPPKDDKWKAKYQEPAAPDKPELIIPAEWVVTTIEQVSTFVTDGDHNPPKRMSWGIPHLTAKNVVNWTLRTNGCTYISEEDFEKVRKRYNPEADDVIVTSVGTIGRTAIVSEGFVFSADRNLAAIRLFRVGMLPKFLLIALNTPFTQRWMATASGSTAQPHLYLADIRSLQVPLPSEPEQTQILEEVELRLSVADEIEATLDAELKRAERLRQSILKRAFEGKLVSQDPNDEPASVLLEKIKAERAEIKSQGKTPTPKKRRDVSA